MQIALIIESIILLFLVLKRVFKHYDGKLVVDEARDSWTVTITTKPWKVIEKKSIELKIEKH